MQAGCACCGQGAARLTSSIIGLADKWDHFTARMGFRREGHRVGAGLFALGSPTPDSPVFVTSNYTLSFDALRSSLVGIDCYIMVLETYGINVWCAAGKGTFGTDELVRRIEETHLADVVRHRELILPQLGATGVAAHHVQSRTGFAVEFGPVRARDLPEYLKTHVATPEMRRVRFDLADRLVVVPVELMQVSLPMLAAAVLAWLLGGWIAACAILAAVLAGAVLFPILLPFLPTRDFTTKGWLLGGLAVLPFAVAAFMKPDASAVWLRFHLALVPMLALPPVSAYIALNFTGSSTFSSKTGVRREIFRYIPLMAASLGIGIALQVVYFFIKGRGVQ